MKIEKRYLSTWHYNVALIFNELETIINNNGGRICSTWKRSERPLFEIVNRGILEKARELEKEKSRFEQIKKEVPQTISQELERLAQIKNDPIITPYADYLYISFVYDGYYYYYQMERNPFFDFLFIKTKMLNENTTTKNVYGSTPSREWMYDCFLRFDCSNSDRREAANLIFNEIVNAPCSAPYHTKERNNTNTLYFYEEGGKK